MDKQATMNKQETPLLAAHNIMKEYDGETILAGCDVEIFPGDVVALIGPSGCGKSTLLSIAGLLLHPSAGRVLIEGAEVTSLSDVALSRVRAETFGFVFQHTQLIGSLRAIDNILVGACFGGADMQAAATRAADLVERFGLAHRVNHFPHQLSVGQKRRVALARALVLNPRLIVADEPTNDLDEESASVVARTIVDFADEEHAVLMATHDRALASQATRVLRLDDGTLEEISPQEVKEMRRAC